MTKEMLEDLSLSVAFNDAARRIEETQKEKMGFRLFRYATAAACDAILMQNQSAVNSALYGKRCGCLPGVGRRRKGWRLPCCSMIAAANARLAQALTRGDVGNRHRADCRTFYRAGCL